MSKLARVIGIAFAGLLTAGIAACGSDVSSQTVIEVRDHAISRANFEHWMAVTAARDYELSPRRPVPKWVLPDPPRFARCIAHLHSLPPSVTPASGGPEIPVRAQCQRRYNELRKQVLTSLTTAEWLISEGEEQGARATAAEVHARFAAVRRNLFPNDAAFERYLANTGETVADQLFRAEVKVYSAKLEAKARAELSSGAISQQALARRAATFPRRWAAKTSCVPGYVMPNCKQYTGHSPPMTELL